MNRLLLKISGVALATMFLAAGCGSDSGDDIIIGDTQREEIVVTGDLAEDTTWTADNVYLLKGRVSVPSGVTLTIEPGTEIRGSKEPLGWLQVQRGGKLMAVGTVTQPIVFTSSVTDETKRQRGDWGGVVLLGNASNNVGTDVELEGNGGTFGGSDDSDSSGTLEYVRIEYAGWELSPDNELNGLTLGSVGSGTTLSHVQVHFGLDDGIEWFGGSVNGDHLVVSGVADDCFDTDLGYSGIVQWAVCIQAAGQGDNGIEASNNADNFAAAPVAFPKFANYTFIGRGEYGSGKGNGIRFKEGGKGTATNGVVMNFVDGAVDFDEVDVAGFDIRNTLFFGNKAAGNATIAQVRGAEEQAYFENTAATYGNSFTDDPQLNSIDPEDPNLLPKPGSPALDCAAPAAPFDTSAAYCGAFKDQDWMAGWTKFSPTEDPVAGAVAVQGDIDSNTTWTADNTYLLVGRVSVKAPATLTIEPGTTILGTKEPLGWLQVERGAKLMAVGTATQPIVFTSSLPEGKRQRGDWGGVVILGKGINNVGTDVQLEGNGGTHGGSDNADNSGELKYVRIEYAGWELSPDNELNGLTLGSVGSGTRLSYVQVHYGLDDGIEWFGGKLVADHLLVTGVGDDCFDTDMGVDLRVQYAVCLQDKGFGDNGIEASNQDPDANAAPRAYPKFANFTFVGRGEYASGKGNGLKYKEGTRGLAVNGIVMNFVDSAIDMDDYATGGTNAADGSTVTLSNLIFYGNRTTNAANATDNIKDDTDNTDEVAFVNSSTAPSFVDPKLASVSFASPDLMPASDSPAVDGSCGADATTFGFSDAASYCGAIKADNWLSGWTTFEQN
ncbi:MAG: hypothetical protein D6761_03440 [Candidatus Dadabacteria bacterium]|nr:MAG: hypothetical protein D6761_03440 [Candidatus Dadabacteria bacterium]